MTSPRNIAEQLDVMAYADRQLDPPRRRQVEVNLTHSPDLLETARAIAMQNEAILAAHTSILEEPVPKRLLSTLEDTGPTRRLTTLARIAAVAVVALATGAAGWWGGQWLGVANSDDATSFLEIVTSTEPPEAWRTIPTAALPAAAQPLQWLSERVMLELRAPSLMAQGYRLIGKVLVEINGEPAVRLTYQRDDGETISLFMRTRWRDTPPTVSLDDSGGAAAAYWFDGPMMWVLTGDAEADELGALADTIHGTTRLEPSRTEAAPAQNAMDINSPNGPPIAIPQ
jgi:anti-sigma factor RsiW